jgi:hypothetical protein
MHFLASRLWLKAWPENETADAVVFAVPLFDVLFRARTRTLVVGGLPAALSTAPSLARWLVASAGGRGGQWLAYGRALASSG